MTTRLFDCRDGAARTALVGAILSALILSGIPAPVYAVSKDAQELMALREKHAPVNCELTRLSRQQSEARAARDQDKVKALSERMQTLDKQISADKPRMDELRKSVRGTPDYPAILQQQVKFDKACNPQAMKP